jgi:hypothetical protein
MTSSKSIWQSVVLAAFLIAISLAAAWSARVGTIPGDWPTRITMILSMLMIAYYGNTIPKVIAREAAARRALRLAGWAFVLAGIASAALWAFAPLDAQRPFRSPSLVERSYSPSAAASGSQGRKRSNALGQRPNNDGDPVAVRQ